MNYTIYYFDPSKVKTFKDCYVAEKVSVANGYEELVSNNNLQNLDFTSIAFVQTDKKKQPPWVSFIRQNYVLDNVENVSNSVILLIKITAYKKNHFFAIVGGQGFAGINKARIKFDFGLKVVLNTIDPLKISIFDSKNFNANQKQSRTTFAKGNPIQEFQFDENEELLNLMSGKPIDTNFAKRISGAVPLHLSTDINFTEIGKRCQFLLKKYRASDYKKTFPFADKFKPIDDEIIINDLNEELKDYILTEGANNISLSFPTIDDFDPSNTYEYFLGSDTLQDDEFEIEQIFKLIKQAKPSPLTVNTLSSINIHSLDSSGSFKNTFNFLDVIAFEFKDSKGDHYFLNNSHWFKIEKKYVNDVEKEFNSIPIIADTSYLPNWKAKESEGSYNARLDQLNFCIYDKKLFSDKAPSSTSKVEVCDAFDKKNKRLVCVKKYSGSATLSHLFAQGSVSLQLLADYEKYKKFFCKKTNDHFKTKEFKPESLKISDYSVIYAIATARPAPFSKFIPFFSKINILTHVRIIKTKGAKVGLYKIDIV